jgi:hypothetical protein
MEDPKLEEDAEFDESGHAKSAGLASRPAPVLQLNLRKRNSLCN